MRGLIAKTFRELWWSTLLFGLGVFLFAAMLTFVIPHVYEGFTAMMPHLPFVRQMITALLGHDVGDQLSARVMQSIVWVHPAVLSLLWASEIVLCTRYPAGEIDRGTIDVLLGMPVSRRAVYVSETLAWLATGVFLLAMLFLGHRIMASRLPEEMHFQLGRVFWVVVNLYCIYLAVGSLAFLISAFSNRRGRAIGAVFALVLVSFVLTFIAQFWEPARTVEFLSVLHYYRPAEILETGTAPAKDLAVLLVFAAGAWLIAGEYVARRDICTV